jgi:hypothetical protein
MSKTDLLSLRDDTFEGTPGTLSSGLVERPLATLSLPIGVEYPLKAPGLCRADEAAKEKSGNE